MELEVTARDGSLRCPYCHDDFEGEEESVECGACAARSHQLCVAELRACAACGAAGAGGTIKVVIPKWIQPPSAVREYCSRKHVKVRRQAGVRRSGLCVGCQEEWLQACGDDDLRAALIAERSQGATPLSERIGSRWDEPQPRAQNQDVDPGLTFLLVVFWAALVSEDPRLWAAFGVALVLCLIWKRRQNEPRRR